jgi:adenylosuccinate lyase
MAYTHLQPAEPTTVGYRLALTAQDLLADWKHLHQIRKSLRGKGFKGAVGTGASYQELLGAEKSTAFENALGEKLDLAFYPVSSQTYPRKQEYYLITGLSGLGGTLSKFAIDLRVLQSPGFGEMGEGFREKQVGSSAMPFKRNPIRAEKICSLARMLAQYPRLAWDNAAHSLLERTLDDSANRRTMLPESFLLSDELLKAAVQVVQGLRFSREDVERQMRDYGPFAATERVLLALTRAGADRQEVHEQLRKMSVEAWEQVQAGAENPLLETISAFPEFRKRLSREALLDLMDSRSHTGFASRASVELADQIKEEIRPFLRL